jgi:hypothetical protein
MSMYLPNPDLHPTGWEPGEFFASEFIEAHRAGQPGDVRPPGHTNVMAANTMAANRKATS